MPEAKTHLWSAGAPKIKVSDTIRIVDEVPVDVRIALNEAAKLGPADLLDSRAALLKELYAKADAEAKARRIMDARPDLVPDLPHPSRPWLNVALLMLGVATLLMVVAQYARPPHPAPSAEPERAALQASEVPKRVPPTRKGR